MSAKTGNPSPANGIVLKGSCKCGAVTYTSTALPVHISTCHCTTCQSLSSSMPSPSPPSLTFADFPPSALTFSPGSALETVRASDIAVRGACRECKMAVSMKYDFEDSVGIVVDTIDRDTVKGELGEVEEHVFVDCAKEVPDDGKRRLGRFTPGFTRKIEEWRKKEGQSRPT
jgi:hypothetical protein